MSRPTRYTSLHRAVLMACASGMALCAASAAGAQEEASDAEDADLDTLVVTGSRIGGVAPVGSPVISMGQQDVLDTGAVTVDRMIRELPQVYDLGVSENSRGQAGGNGNIVFGNTVNLRGIGPYATLLIVDGHRIVNNSRSSDPSILPTLGVERVDVVADGASAIYGSDAIAGVVNLIPRRSLDGVELRGRYSAAERGGFNEYSIGGAFGKVADWGQIMLAYEHVDRSNLSGDDREFFTSDQSVLGGADYRVNRCNPGTIIVGEDTYAIPAGGLTADNVGDLVLGTSNLCDDIVGQDLFPEQSYDTANLAFTYEIAPRLTFLGDAFISQREFERQPGYSAATLLVPETNAFYVPIPGVTGPYQVAYSFIDDLPRNTQSGAAKSWQVSPKLELSLTDSWMVDALIAYGETEDESNTYRGFDSRGSLAPALASSDPATALDPFGLNRTSQAVLDELSDQIFLAPTNTAFTGYELHASGDLFQLPGGAVKLALGYERQEWTVDLGLARGPADAPLNFRTFERDVNSAFAELYLPLVGAGNAMPGVESLELNLAVRSDDYSDVGDTTNPKVGVNWSPTQSAHFKASYGTSFRAPLISQIYGNSNALFGQSYQDPAGGAPILGFAQSGPNLDLKPEEATTWTIGGDFDVTPDIRVGFTFFDVEYENQVETYLADLAILSREDLFEGTGIILRDEAAAARVIEVLDSGIPLARGAFPGGDPANVTLYVDGRNNNLGKSITQGIDFYGSYTLNTQTAGDVIFDVGGVYLTKYESAITGTSPTIDHLNEIFQPATFKARASVTWDIDPWRARMSATHINSYDNVATTPVQSVKSYSPIDLTISRLFTGDTVFGGEAIVQFEVRNLFDTDPPYVNIAPSVNGSGGYDATAADPIGRTFGASVTTRW